MPRATENKDESKRLKLIAEAVRYCQRAKSMGMPSSCYTKALREPIHFLWERRAGSKTKAARYRSRASVGMRSGNGDLIYDHAIPFRILQDELLGLPEVNEATLAATLERYGTIALITRSENALLNAAGYGRRMPEGWDQTNPLARYVAIGIELIENTDS